ncbi:MAG: hypothetical protein QOD38_1094, partial [Acidimicrobiaceae bacterium]
MTASPATAVDLDNGAVFHFARGTDGALWRYVEGATDGLGTSWRKVGGQLVGGPAATVVYAGDGGVITVVVRGSDNAAWITYVYPTGPTTYVWDSRGFMSLGGILTSDPAVGSVGSLYVFGRGTDGALWLYNGSTWQSLEGQLIG